MNPTDKITFLVNGKPTTMDFSILALAIATNIREFVNRTVADAVRREAEAKDPTKTAGAFLAACSENAKQTELPLDKKDEDVDAVLAPSDFRKRKLVRLYDFIPAGGRGVETGRPLLFSLKKSGFPIVGRTVSTEVQQITDMLSILERLGLIVRAVPRGHTVFKNASISRPDAILAISELRTGAHGKLVKQTA